MLFLFGARLFIVCVIVCRIPPPCLTILYCPYIHRPFNVPQALLDETLFHHTRRLIVSCFIYCSIIFLTAQLPTMLLRTYFPAVYDGIFPIPFPTSYLWTSGQVAAEVAE